MRIGFIVTSPYQLFHFKRIYEHFSATTVYVEVRERELGVTDNLVDEHLPGADVVWISSRKLASIDGRCEVIVCHTPVPLMHFYSKSLVVAQQYSLAKERYQYGAWRAQASLNLMYGEYSASCVSGFSNAIAVGNPLLDGAFSDGEASHSFATAPSQPRVLYMPTYGDLSNKERALRKLLAEDVRLSIKLHHAEANSTLTAKAHSVQIVGSDVDPIEAILQHDVVVSDYSGAIYDALALRRPVVVIGGLNEQSRDVHRLSEGDRSRSDIEDLVASWEGNAPFPEVYERARIKLTDRTVFDDFLGRYFVNLGHAGKACAQEITKLVEQGEPDSFAVRQVREANRHYILENRRIRGQLKTSKVSKSKRINLSDLKRIPPKALILKGVRWCLLRTPGGDRALQVLRRLRGDARPHASNQEGHPGGEGLLSLPPVARLRRQAILSLFEGALRAAGVDYRTEITQGEAYCAVRDADLGRVCKLLNELGTQYRPAQLHVWLGQGSRYDEVRFAESISFTDAVECDSMVIGVPYQNELYGIDRRGGAELLILERRDTRLVARQVRAQKVDWTRDFDCDVRSAVTKKGDINGKTVKSHVLEREPIDIVYTWVDSADTAWQAARTMCASRQNVELESAANDERYLDRQELRYSLRSVWLYVPFVRNIYIVTAGHSPKWLNLDHKAIHMISHDDIFPDPSDLPTFNSHAIEACLHRIPGLSEHFVYFNDDVFLGRELGIDTFFSKAGLIKSRFSPSSFAAIAEPGESAIPTDWASYNAVRLIARDFGLLFDRKMKHVPMPMKRSLLVEIEERYADLMAKTRTAHFRSQSDVSVPSMLGHYYGIATGKAVEVENKPGEYAYADTGRRDFESRLRAITRNNPLFVCLNVTRHTDIELGQQAALLRNFLEQRYPVPSPYEVTSGIK